MFGVSLHFVMVEELSYSVPICHLQWPVLHPSFMGNPDCLCDGLRRATFNNWKMFAHAVAKGTLVHSRRPSYVENVTESDRDVERIARMNSGRVCQKESWIYGPLSSFAVIACS